MLFLCLCTRPLRVIAMRGLPSLVLAAASSAVLATPALASDITVASPINGTHVTAPVWVRAHNIGCDSVPPTAFGYSIDNSSTLVRGATAYDVDVAHQALAAGTHIIHFKSWTARGACPTVSTQFVAGSSSASTSSVTTPPSSASSSGSASYGVPGDAANSGDLDGQGPWDQTHDGGTPGSSRGSSVYPATTPVYDDAREFYMTYSDRGGERWSIDAGNDAAATHFVLDTYVFLPSPSEILNLEMDINQVTSSGDTIILGTQCSGVTGTWEAGYTSGKYDHWWSSSIKCNPAHWAANTWHHVQVGMHRDSSGVVTHDWVDVDGVHSNWGYSHESAHALGWEPGVVNVQYQIEGANGSSGSVTSYIHKMTVYRW